MKYFLTLLLLLTSLCASSKWDFTQQDFNTLTKEQKEVIKNSYWVGKTHGLGTTLAAISIVESRAGAFPDNRSRVCGAHQVNVYDVKENLGTQASPFEVCKIIKGDSFISAIVSLEILLYWKENSKSYKGMLNRYNRGWDKSSYDAEYLRRMSLVLKVLNNNNLEKL